MFGLMFPHVSTPEQEAAAQRRLEATLAKAVPWVDGQPWTKHLILKGDTWINHNPFPELPATHVLDLEKLDSTGFRAVSPDKQFLYCNRILPRGYALTCYQGKRGTVRFDSDVVVPCLYRKVWGKWDTNPWMSTTPQEVFTLRPGTRLARGHTVIAGLGLGYQLVQVLRKKTVTQVTLIEKSTELVDWMLPRVMKRVSRDERGKMNPVIIGDACWILPSMAADVALVDIYPSYGNNTFNEECPFIKKLWVWGSAKI